jgi:hypothetical protein
MPDLSKMVADWAAVLREADALVALSAERLPAVLDDEGRLNLDATMDVLVTVEAATARLRDLAAEIDRESASASARACGAR